jgi:hypothetical protein
MTANDKDPGHGILHSAFDVFVDGTRAVTELVTSAGTAGARAVVPDPVLVPLNRMLTSLRTIAAQAPQLTDELDVLVEEVHAKRLSIQALQTELGALDHQLQILEAALVPVQTWTHQWGRVQHALLDTPDNGSDHSRPSRVSAAKPSAH